MKKITTFMLLAAALLISVPSWAVLVPGELTKLNQYTSYSIRNFGSSNDFGTICVPERIVATQGIVIYDITCVDMFWRGGTSDTTEVARLVVDVHKPCYGMTQRYTDPKTGQTYYEDDEPFCPYYQGWNTTDNPCEAKVYIDWIDHFNDDEPEIDHRMVAGGAYFYTICAYKDTSDCKIWVDKSDRASEPVCVNGFHGTFEQTKINTPVTVLTQDVNTGVQFLEQVTKVTIPANRGYFLGNFECVPWRWNTHDNEPEPFQDTKETPNDIHYPCSPAPVVPRKVSSNAVAFNVGPRDAATGLYPIDLEHPIYLGKETNKRIENGQLIIEAADGSIYNAFGLKLR